MVQARDRSLAEPGLISASYACRAFQKTEDRPALPAGFARCGKKVVSFPFDGTE